MYPFLRLSAEIRRARRMAPLALTGTHVTRTICLPWDLDPWVELNNGRTLTLFDIGRIPVGIRTGLTATLRAQGWGLTVAGVSFRYRRRIRVWERVELRARCLGWDARFLYIEQAMVRAGEVTSHGLYRMAVTSAAGIIPPAQVIAVMGRPPDSPPLPDWVLAWAQADSERPWPPEI
jgi:acyl-CoA thioesterase FadM